MSTDIVGAGPHTCKHVVVATHPFFREARAPAVWAHRGAWSPAPDGPGQNSMAAVLAALALGADGVEIDVRRSADGALVIHHDPAVAGPGPRRPIAELRRDELGQDIADLATVLAAAGAGRPGGAGRPTGDRPFVVNVEIKNLPHEPAWDPGEILAVEVAGALARWRGDGSTVTAVVSSFSLASIDAARAAHPGLATGWLTPLGYDQMEALETLSQRGHVALHPHHLAVTDELVATARDRGVAVVAWTVDDVDRILALADMGVAAVITNRPALALAALA